MKIRNLMTLALAACTIGAIAARAAEDNQAFEKIERGRYLAVLGDCVGCHTAPGGKPFAGGAALETPFGALIGPNITPDVATGIGAWSEEDFCRAMHEGIGRDGARLYPAMPYPAYTKVTREDVSAIWAYLRTLEPVHNEVQPNQLEVPVQRSPAGNIHLGFDQFQARACFNPIRQSRMCGTVAPIWSKVSAIAEPVIHRRTSPAAIGADEALQGALLQDWYAPDLTRGSPYGHRQLVHEEIVRYLKTGANSYDIASGPMAEAVSNSTSIMTDADLLAIATYLKDRAPRSANSSHCAGRR